MSHTLDDPAVRRRNVFAAPADDTGTGWNPTRARFVLKADQSPTNTKAVYVAPFLTSVFNDGDVTMNPDSTVTINTTGLYRCSMGGTWRDSPDGQVDLRIVGVGHCLPGQKPGSYVKGKLTKVSGKTDRLGQHDICASNVPRMARYQGTWAPARIAQGAIASIDITLPRAGVVTLGDVAIASHTGITDAAIGTQAVTTLIVSAKVIAPDIVRVSIYNPAVAAGVLIPSGTLKIVAMTAVDSKGSSGLGQTVMTSGIEPLNAGDSVYGYFRAKSLGDSLTAVDTTFLQIERWN